MSFLVISRPIRIFYSYAARATRDKNLFQELKKYLGFSRQRELIDDSFDSASGDSERITDEALNNADIIVLLVSAEYVDSMSHSRVEMRRALERNKIEKVRLILVRLDPTDLKDSPLAEYHFLPSNGKPVSQRSGINRDALAEIASAIREAAEALTESVNARSLSQTQIPLDNIPYGHNPFFTDREATLTALHNYFALDQTFQQTRTQALHGPIGIGKTQIAVEYAHRYKHEYQAILWLDAASRDLLQGIYLLADPLAFSKEDRSDEQSLLSALKRWLQYHDKWLFILDNLSGDDFKLMNRFIPFQSTGHVLVTTLSRATGPLAHPVPVAEMEPDKSVVFLLRRARTIGERDGRNAVSETDYKYALSLVQAVDGLSLALDQAGAYIEETGCGLARYLKLYPLQKAKLLAQRGNLIHSHPESVDVTLSLIFKKIDEEYPEALNLLYFFAFLHHDAIPEEMLERGASALDGPLHTLAADAVALDRAIGLLLRYSLVQRHTDPSLLSIHRVVQTILQEKLIKQQRKWATQVVRLVNSTFPTADFRNWPDCERYLPQARHCAELIAKYRLTQKEAVPLLLHLGSYCYMRAFYQESERYLRIALPISEQEKGPDPPNMALVLNNLGLVSHRQGKYQEAETYHQRARAIREQKWGPEHQEVAQTLSNLAFLYKDWGKYQQAEELYKRVLLIDERTVGPDHSDAAASLNNLALVYDEQGKHPLAEPLYQRVFSIEEHTLPADHPDRALSLNIQAMECEEQSNYEEAEALYQRALAIQEQTVGLEHPDTAHTLNNLADLYEVQEKYSEAEALYQRALSIYEQALGSEHPDTANALNNLAYLSCQQGRYQEAEALYQRALSMYERVPGPPHPGVAHVLNNLGDLYHLIKKDEQAEPLLRRGLEICEQVFGPEHLDTCRSLRALFELLRDQHRFEQAEPLLQRIANIYQQTFGPEYPDTVFVLKQHSTLLERINEQGRS